MERIEALRPGRALVCFFNFDRESQPPLAGIQTNFASDTKEPLFRVLKETAQDGRPIDLCLYTRGGDTNAVWPIASLLREFDPDFQVLVPFRCHSAGTLLALASKMIIMTELSELSPIDPSTGNQFNPPENDRQNKLPISVEDVQQYRNFVVKQFAGDGNDGNDEPGSVGSDLLAPFLVHLSQKIHPLALGNVHRVHLQTKQLANNMLSLHAVEGQNLNEIIESLTSRFFSHLHMINRQEALSILGDQRVVYANKELSSELDRLMRNYEDDFDLRSPFFLTEHLQDKLVEDARFIGGAIESRAWSYLNETRCRLRQHSQLPPNVQVQLPQGQPMPLVPGLPRQFTADPMSQGWAHNKDPKGITK